MVDDGVGHARRCDVVVDANKILFLRIFFIDVHYIKENKRKEKEIKMSIPTTPTMPTTPTSTTPMTPTVEWIDDLKRRVNIDGVAYIRSWRKPKVVRPPRVKKERAPRPKIDRSAYMRKYRKSNRDELLTLRKIMSSAPPADIVPNMPEPSTPASTPPTSTAVATATETLTTDSSQPVLVTPTQ